MKKKEIVNKYRLWIFLASVGVTALFLLFFALRYGFAFEENDDRFISQILSGTLTGENSFRTVFNNFLVSFPLSLLYRLNAAFPWWGLFVVFVAGISMVGILYYTAKTAVLGPGGELREKSEKGIVSPAVCLVTCFSVMGALLLLFSQYLVFGSVQFTSVAILAAAAGYFCLILGGGKKSSYILFFVMELTAFCLRDKSMLLVQPLGFLLFLGAGFAGVNHTKEEIVKKPFVKKILFTALLILIVFILGLFGRALAGEYKKDWREFESFNKMRSQLYDYSGIYSYDEVKEILKKYNISKTQWEAFADYSISEWPMNEELDKELIAYAKEHENRPAFPDLAKEYVKQSLLRGEARPVLLLWVIAIVFALVFANYRMFLPILGIFLARTASWGYLVYGGRILDRVTIPLFLAEEIALFAVIVLTVAREDSFEKRKYPKYIISGASLLLFAVIALHTGRNELRTAHNAYESQKILSESFRQVSEYCLTHPDESFILDVNSFNSVHGTAFEENLTASVNYKMSGGWFAAMPEYKESFEKYLQKNPDFSFIVFDFGPEWSRIEHGTADYYRHATGCEPVLTDQISVSSGGTYLVYRFTDTKKQQ